MLLSQEEIHHPDNFEIAAGIAHNKLNVAMFKNQRLQRIKPRQKLSEPSQLIVSSDNFDIDADIRKTKATALAKTATGSLAQVMRPTQGYMSSTVYRCHFKTSANQQQQTQRIYTSNPGKRNFRKRDQTKLNKSIHKAESLLSEPEAVKAHKKQQCEKIEKGHLKKGLEVKNLENWLNDMLIEFCYEEKFDLTINLPALKKYQIDRNSLLSKGLSHQQIDRVYSSLFVYSIGFNKLLEQLSSSSDSEMIRKTLWKVYANLLQYCSKGEFDTTVGNIERDRARNVEKLKQEILESRKIIQESRERNEQENSKMRKQYEQLKELNKQLNLQKKIVEEDFKQADQAFNEEVSLRLKFEHKINEIHGVHRQLGMKHMRLMEDFATYKKQYQRLEGEKTQEVLRVEALKVEKHQLEGTIDNMRLELKDYKNHIEQLEYNLDTQTRKAILLETQMMSNKSDQEDQERQAVLLKFEIQNLAGKLNLREKAFQEQVRQVEVLVGQNRTMYQKMEDQKSRIEQLVRIQHDFQLTSLNLKTRVELMTNKFDAKSNEFEELALKHEQTVQKLQECLGDLNLSNQKCKLLQSDIDSFNQSIEMMKKAKNAIEDEAIALRKQNATIKEILTSKEHSEAENNRRLIDAEEQLAESKATIVDLETRLKFKEDSFNHEKMILQKKYDKTKVERDELFKKDEEREELMAKLLAENEQCKANEAAALTSLRDEKFERNNLQLQYKQSLLVMEDENKYIKDLNRTMSQLKEERDSCRRQLKAVQFTLAQRTQQFRKDETMLNGMISQLKQEVHRLRMYIHPMLYHDLYCSMIRETNRLRGSELANMTLREQMKAMEEHSRLVYNQSMQQAEEKRRKVVQEKDGIIFSKEKEIEYLKEQQQVNSERIKRIETALSLYQKNGLQEDPRMIMLEEKIKEKEKKIEQVSKQMVALQERNSDLNKRFIYSSNQLEQQKTLVKKTMGQIHRLEKEIEEVRVEKHEVEVSYQRKINEQQEVYNTLMLQFEDLKDNLPERRPTEQLKETVGARSIAADSNNGAGRAPSGFSKQPPEKQTHKHTKTNLSSKDKKQQSAGNSKSPQNKNSQLRGSQEIQKTGESFQGNSDVADRHRTDRVQRSEAVQEMEREKEEKRRIADQSRRDIVRKLHGANNYYNNIK